jgi:hypothetical protein
MLYCLFCCRSQLLYYTAIFTYDEVPAGDELTYDYGEQYHTTVRTETWGLMYARRNVRRR